MGGDGDGSDLLLYCNICTQNNKKNCLLLFILVCCPLREKKNTLDKNYCAVKSSSTGIEPWASKITWSSNSHYTKSARYTFLRCAIWLPFTERSARARLRHSGWNSICLQYLYMNYNQFEFVWFNCKSQETVVSSYNYMQDNIKTVSVYKIHVRILITCIQAIRYSWTWKYLQ